MSGYVNMKNHPVSKFEISGNTMSYYDAISYCQNNYDGGDAGSMMARTESVVEHAALYRKA